MRPTVIIDYTNHRGVRAKRNIVPQEIYFANSTYHGLAWVLKAFDNDKQAMREFALRDIHSWSDVLPPSAAEQGG